MTPSNFSQELARATHSRLTAHFDIRYSLREPGGERTQMHGVRDEEIILNYAEGLEEGWARLSGLDLPGEKPGIEECGRIVCLVTCLHLIMPGEPEPFCLPEVIDGKLHPHIGLPSGFRELVDVHSERAMARCTARHEAAHAWTYLYWRSRWQGTPIADIQRGIRRFLTEVLWLLEGHAVTIEADGQGTGFWLQHAWSWCDKPEVSLWIEPYSAGLFSRYLDRRLKLLPGELFTRVIGHISSPPKPDQERPAVWRALDRTLLPLGLSAEEAWLESCLAGAFIGMPGDSPEGERAVFERYGKRARAEHFHLLANEEVTSASYEGASLSCRYFGLNLSADARKIHLHATIDRYKGQPNLWIGLWPACGAGAGRWWPAGGPVSIDPVRAADGTMILDWVVVCALMPDSEDARWEEPADPPTWSFRISTE